MENKDGEDLGMISILSTVSMENEDGGDFGTTAVVSTDFMGNEESVPFVKHSPLWKSICSSEAYRKMKRKPQFYLLKEHKEVLCEGSTIGLMVNFIILVEHTLKLQSFVISLPLKLS